jgi:hypothetical protein
MSRVASWGDRVVGFVADEHFRIAIRRAPDAELWSFAFEWNRTTRVIGFFGDRKAMAQLRSEIPQLPMVTIGTSPDGGVLRMRAEVPLQPGMDVMFQPAGFDGAPNGATKSNESPS